MYNGQLSSLSKYRLLLTLSTKDINVNVSMRIDLDRKPGKKNFVRKLDQVGLTEFDCSSERGGAMF